MSLVEIAKRYQQDGFVYGLPVMTREEVQSHRAELENAESALGHSLHYLNKVHTVLTSPFELATNTKLLDLVEALIGPDIMLYNVTFIIKEPHTRSFVSWHQDLTYWGLNGGNQVSAWLALSAATEASGCMKMIPNSHTWGECSQRTGSDPDNILLQAQTIENVDESKAVPCTLAPGEVSLHHGWTVHCSRPNVSNDRRIGLNIQYITPDMRQEKSDHDSALLIRGEDRFGYYASDIPAKNSALTPESIAHLNHVTSIYRDIAGR